MKNSDQVNILVMPQVQNYDVDGSSESKLEQNKFSEYFNYELVNYRQVYTITCTWVGNEIVDHSDVVGASPVGAAPTSSSFSTEHMASKYCAKTTASWVEKCLSFRIWCVLY